MNVPKAWIKILCLVSLFALTHANIDSKEFFCGKKLVRTLMELCSIYNNPTFVHHRFRRQIVEECCRSQCSRRYLVQYYCEVANQSVANLLQATPENTSQAPIPRKELPPAPPRSRMPKVNLITKRLPPANIGHVEHSQNPFYVWRFARMH